MNDHEKSLLNRMEHAVFVLEPDAEGLPRYSAYSRFALNALGKTEADILGLTARDIFPGRLGEIAFDHHVECLKTGIERTYEILLPIQSRPSRVRTTLRPELDHNGRPIRLIGSATDISSAQMMEEVRTGFDTINNEMEDFINLAAHDLRVPMRHVGAIADLLRADFRDLGDGKLQLIDMLEDIGSKAMYLIGDVLAQAQITGAAEDVFEFELQELVTEIMVLLDPMKQCKITVPEVRIEGDRTATQIILRNLIDNALKHGVVPQSTGPDLSSLKLTLKVADTHGFFEIEVQDNGVGFKTPTILFLNGGKLQTDSGFGMLGVRRLINARGGMLTATNVANGLGASVKFSLPGKAYLGPEHQNTASAIAV